MPKVTWMNKPPPVNYLAALLRAYKQANRLTSAQLAERLGCRPENVRYQISKPAKAWNVGMLMDYCDALGVPYEEAFREATK